MKTLFFRLYTLWLALVFCLANTAVALESKPSRLKPLPVAEIPISIINNRVQFDMVAGDTTLRLLLDTGATSSIFFPSEKVLHLNPDVHGAAKIAFPAINEATIGHRIKELPLRSGDFEFVSRGGLLIGADTSVAAQLEAEYDVILGQEFFKNYTVEVDPGTLTMRLYYPGTDLSQHFETRHRLYMEGHTPHIRFYSQLPWEERATSKSLLLDTGYPGSMVFWSKRHYRKARDSGQLVEKNENSAGIVSHIKLSFGDLVFENIPVFIASAVPMQSMKRDGLIGASILAQHRHVIDFAQARLFMSPLYGASGKPLQIIDGLIYTPNNENFDVKTFYPEVPTYPTLIIHGNGDTSIQ